MESKSSTGTANISTHETNIGIDHMQWAARGFAIIVFLLASMDILLGCSGDDDIATDHDSGIEASSEDSSTADATQRPGDENDPKDGRDTGDTSSDAPTVADASDERDSACVYEGPPVIDVEQLETCSLCEGAHCLATDLVDEEYLDLLADCEAGQSKCVPDVYLETGGQFSLDTCTSMAGTEGRCMSLCIPLVADLKDILPIDGCQSYERCTPCYNPVTGEETGACGVSCDPGPTEKPYRFNRCCDALSLCIPEDLVPEADRLYFGSDSCSEEDVLCIPKEMAADPNGFVPKSCESLAGAEGRCLPNCLPAVEDNASYLPQDRCPDGYTCFPCFDPITGEDTGACTIAGDKGSDDDPVTFPECCEGISFCVPVDAIPESARELLDQDVCKSDDSLCVPKPLALDPGNYVAESCTIWDGAEGRCLPACLPDVAKRADWLPQADCPEGYLCAPCTDPITAEVTGACSIAGDPGLEDDPYTFSECCGGLSLCVPEESVPEAYRSNFGTDGCSMEGALCVPKEIASDPGNYIATKCRSWKGAEGRCLPDCLPEVAAAATRLGQDMCEDGYLCVPCTDPVTREATPACTLGADPGPSESPVYFDSCCGGISVCAPKEVVPDDEEPNFDSTGCEENELCVPKDFATNTYVPLPCLGWNDAEARCLPACLPPIAANSDRIVQGSCPDDYLCAPCYDPVSWENTGSCELRGDAPQRDPSEYIFAECCGQDHSVCAPVEAIPDEYEDLLDPATCDENEMCIPKQFGLNPTGFGADLVHCESWGGGEGRCLSICMRAVMDAMAILKPDSEDYEDGCESGFMCVPCFYPNTGESTGACTLAGDAPTEPLYQFPPCCLQGEISRGTCVPSALVPEGVLETLQNDQAAEDVCDVEGQIDEDFVCAPKELASDPDLIQPSNCLVTPLFSELEGLCLADCFKPEQYSSFDLQGNCEDTNDECLPCDYGAPCESQE